MAKPAAVSKACSCVYQEHDTHLLVSYVTASGSKGQESVEALAFKGRLFVPDTTSGPGSSLFVKLGPPRKFRVLKR